uniref:Uncharacterized protein n=1 Tax=Arundo donax TaxID=35708 RepID=A0A0A8ZKU2_ARUDO
MRPEELDLRSRAAVCTPGWLHLGISLCTLEPEYVGSRDENGTGKFVWFYDGRKIPKRR